MVTGGQVVSRVVLAVIGTVAALVVLVPVGFVWWLSTPAPTPSADDAGVTGQLRDVAYALRNQRVRTAVDRGADTAAVAHLIGAAVVPPGRIRTAPDLGRLQLVLTRVRRTGRSGLAVELVESSGGSSPASSTSGILTRDSRPWVGCYRVELPALSIAQTEWRASDSVCPTFSRTLQRTDRLHVGATARPLLRPPCYGTTGYCPGG